MRKIAIAALIILSILSFAASANHVAYCSEFKCYGSGSDGLPCTNDDDCKYPVQTHVAETGTAQTGLYADVVLGFMGIAVASLITIVGFTIYAHGASSKKTKTKKRRR